MLTINNQLTVRDILNRHTRIHAQQQPELSINRTQRSAACLQCATSRVRCTRGDPCARCKSKGLTCQRRILPSKQQGSSSEEDRVPEIDAILDPQVPQNEPMPPGLLEPVVIPGDVSWAQEPRFLGGDPPVQAANGGNPLNSEAAYGLGVYGVDPSVDLAARPLSAINWLSPDDRSLQQWASQLASIPAYGVFPANFAMPDVPPLPHLLGTEPTLEWAPASQSSTDQVQIENLLGRRSCSDHAERESPETLLDGQSSRNSQTTDNRYYVQGNSWRASFQSRFRKGQLMDPMDIASMTTSACSTASTRSVSNMNGAASSLRIWLAEDVYASIILAVEETTQTSSHLPPLQAFRLCMHLYFECLHPNFPFLSKRAFACEKPHWILSLAVAGVGAAYLRSSQGSKWKDILMQALDGILSSRLHRFQNETDTTQTSSNTFEFANQVEEILPLIQAKVLHLLCMLHSSTSYICQRAAFERAELVQWCSYLNLVPDSVGIQASRPVRKDIQQWIKAESSLRTGMMIWVSTIVESTLLAPGPDGQHRILTSVRSYWILWYPTR